MKLILLITGFAICSTLLGQNNPQPYIQKQSALKIMPPGKQPTAKKKPTVPKGLQKSTYSHSLQNGNTVMLLEQDNMPCIIPKPEGYIPNAGFNLKDKSWSWTAPIPNPATKNILLDFYTQTPTQTSNSTDTLIIKK